MASFQAKIGWKRPRKREKKIIVPITFNLTRNREFKKNSKKIKQYNYGSISSQNRLKEAEKWRK